MEELNGFDLLLTTCVESQRLFIYCLNIDKMRSKI